MPLVRIALRAGTTPEHRRAIADGVPRAMVETINVPAADRFQVVTEHGAPDPPPPNKDEGSGRPGEAGEPAAAAAAPRATARSGASPTQASATGDLIYDPAYLGIARTDGVVFIQITLNAGRTVEMKKKLYARIAELLAEKPGVRKEDVLINLVEVPKENWSFGNGDAQYA